MKTNEEQMMIAYLLGNVTEEEQARLEEKLFGSDEFYEQLQAIKVELTDDYVRGDLTAADRESFVRRFFVTPENRDEVAFAKAMARALLEISAEQRAPAQTRIATEKMSWRQSLLAFIRVPSLQFSLAVAAILLAFGAYWMFSETRRLQYQLEQARAEQTALQRRQQEWQRQAAEQQARNAELSAQLQREQAERERLKKEVEQSQPTAATVPAFILTPGLIRGANEPEKLIVPRQARQINLQLDLGGDDQYKSFRAELRTARGNLVWSRDVANARSTSLGKVVSMNLPTSLLTNGEYELTLKGVVSRGRLEDTGYYYFNVIKR